MNRVLINVDNEDVQYAALQGNQNKYNKDNDTCNIPSIFSHRVYSSSPLGRWGLWVHGVKAEPNGSDHRRHSYTIQVTKMGMLIIHNTKQNIGGTVPIGTNKQGNRNIGQSIHAHG